MNSARSSLMPPASATTSFGKRTARERITQVVESWFLTEPLLFAAWTMHDVVEQPAISTIRVGRGKVEFNPEFVRSLRRDQLRSVLAFEAMRILLGHPYSRQQPDAALSYQASNLTVQECLRTKLPIERARDVFGDAQYDNQYFEFYYRELAQRASEQPEPTPPSPTDDSQPSTPSSDRQDADSDESGHAPSLPPELGDQTRECDLQSYATPERVGVENTGHWDDDDLQRDEISAAVREAAETADWGTLGGNAREQLLATLDPKLDYRGVLRSFRQSVLSVRRRLTRMKPSRRYGFDQMGSRYDFTTKLLFAVDVSGSMSSRDLRLGFSVVSKFFRYGVESIDVIWFDEDIRGNAVTLRRARNQFDVSGRGGTNFTPIVQYIDQHREYDGLIVFTDGFAPVPPKPRNTRTRLLWLFKDESTYRQMSQGLRPLGRSVFLKSASR